jgi:tetratricopeptide (TPR) repeat protein
MFVKFTSFAAAAVVGLGAAALTLNAPVRAMEEESPIQQPGEPAAPTCAKDQVFDAQKNACVAAASVVACDKGFAYDAGKKTCVKTTALNDETLYNQGRMLALAGHYRPAIDTLGAVGNQTANVLTMIGYSTRKMGDVEGGIAIYYKALALDPKNLSTHEYLGEGYLAAGRVDLAELELDTLQSLCGTTCVQYQALSNALYNSVWN